MTKAFRRLCTFGALLSFASLASAQATAPTPFQKFLGRVDLGVSGSGEFSKNTNGQNYLSQNVFLSPSNTLGALIELRYIASPRIGIQYNYSYARYVDDYSITNTSASPQGASPLIVGVQTKATEYTLGYIGHFGNLFGLQPFVGGGGGILGFRPTAGGGQGYLGETRGAFYYTVGVEQIVYNDHLGFRVQFRQLFYGAPDYNTNYLANGQRSITTQPSAGFFLKF